jgi:hypothetical protein
MLLSNLTVYLPNTKSQLPKLEKKVNFPELWYNKLHKKWIITFFFRLVRLLCFFRLTSLYLVLCSATKTENKMLYFLFRLGIIWL